MSSDSGLIYYNKGQKCLIRMCVSMHSLRSHYDGPVAVLHDGELPAWAANEFRSMGAALVPLPPSSDKALVRKSSLWRWTPFKHTVFLDADTLIVGNIDELFAAVRRKGFMTYHFSGWLTTGGMIGNRIRAWQPAIGTAAVTRALAYGKAVNTGIHGYTTGHRMLPVWEKTTQQGYAKNCTRRLVDELACQVLLPDYPHEIVGEEYGCSVRFGDPASARIIHYHGSKHVLEGNAACDLWRAAYWRYRIQSAAYKELSEGFGDKRFSRYIAGIVKNDITIVTAVNPDYEQKLRANWPLWMATPGIREQQFLVFWNRRCPEWLKAYKNVRLVRWKFDLAGENIRERMLSAFVFGVAREVKTPYWMKLDCDATPTGAAWEWPGYQNYTIIGHKCGYTKTKGQPNAPAHFLNQLDDWFSDVMRGGKWEWAGFLTFFDDDDDDPEHARSFPDNIPTRERYPHKRTASYCAIEKTEHTRELAGLCGDRLPVPSQDTTSWYVAWRLGRPIERLNMRKFFKP